MIFLFSLGLIPCAYTSLFHRADRSLMRRDWKHTYGFMAEQTMAPLSKAPFTMSTSCQK